MEAEDDFTPALDEKEVAEGKMKTARVEGMQILFVKRNNRIFVYDNRCPHMGCNLSAGTFDGSIIVCPCHDWHFNVETGKYVEEAAITLTKYEWKIVSGKIWIKL